MRFVQSVSQTAERALQSVVRAACEQHTEISSSETLPDLLVPGQGLSQDFKGAGYMGKPHCVNFWQTELV